MAKGKNRPIDEARAYRERIHALYDNLPQEPQPLAGVNHDQCQRYVYLTALPGDGANENLNAAFRHWKALVQQRGPLPASLSSGRWLLVVPSGETFYAYQVARFPMRSGEKKAQLVPLVEEAAQLLREFAASTGRRWGVIEGNAEFVCDDGRRFPLTECSYRPLTEADYVRRKKPRTRKPRPQNPAGEP